MKENISGKCKTSLFDGAAFGDKFVTRDGHIAILCGRSIEFDKSVMYYFMILVSPDDDMWDVQDCWASEIDGMCGDEEWRYDIVSRYREPVDEEKLDMLAKAYSPYNFDEDELYEHIQCHPAFLKGFKEGYRKAKE